MSSTVIWTATIERAHRLMPPFVVVPCDAVPQCKLDRLAVLDVVIARAGVRRCPVRRLDARHWIVELPQTVGRWKATVGEQVRITLDLPSPDPPAEVTELLASSRQARKAWRNRTDCQRRTLCDYVAAGKWPASRRARAASALLEPGAARSLA